MIDVLTYFDVFIGILLDGITEFEGNYLIIMKDYLQLTLNLSVCVCVHLKMCVSMCVHMVTLFFLFFLKDRYSD